MRTQSHFLLTALIWDCLNRRTPPILPGRGFLIGSVLPDVPLMILTLWYLLHRLQSENPPSTESPLYGPEYDDYYFNNDYWKLLTSLFHAPCLILLYFAIGSGIATVNGDLGRAAVWFSLSCAFHSIIDIFTHVQDGILLFFPFDWDYRFESWVSYYDPNYGGRMFTVFEYGLDVLLIGYFIYRGIQSSLNQKRIARYIEVHQCVIDNPIV